jgi:hypothetical protein
VVLPSGLKMREIFKLCKSFSEIDAQINVFLAKVSAALPTSGSAAQSSSLPIGN